jgi:hypothetical protein
MTSAGACGQTGRNEPGQVLVQWGVPATRIWHPAQEVARDPLGRHPKESATTTPVPASITIVGTGPITLINAATKEALFAGGRTELKGGGITAQPGPHENIGRCQDHIP